MYRFTPAWLTIALSLCTSCVMSINDTVEGDDPEGEHGQQTPPIAFTTSELFPFQDNTNWWMYSEDGGNTLRIAVTDTISDDGTTYYRVSFQEHQVDTTDDWFQQSSRGILFGTSLTGTYSIFLPSRIASARDIFSSGTDSASFTYYNNYKIDVYPFPRTVSLEYTTPVIHGFDEIVLADSIGIIRMIDYDGRWTIDYKIDSCSVGGTVTRWER